MQEPHIATRVRVRVRVRVSGGTNGVGVLARVSYAETLCKTRNQFQE